jgi:multidrug efflux pump subunit AcrA (membrane-fusion protein)
MIGMTAETNIIIAEHKDALLLPLAALDGDAVWRVADGRLEKVPVTVGIRGTDKAEILSGLGEKDQVAARADGGLVAGARVRAVPMAAAAP